MSGSQDYELDPRNASIRVYVNGEPCPRDQAKVSIFYPGQAVSEALIDYACCDANETWSAVCQS